MGHELNPICKFLSHITFVLYVQVPNDVNVLYYTHVRCELAQENAGVNLNGDARHENGDIT